MTDTDHTIEQLGALAQSTRFSVFRILMKAGPDGLPAGVLADQLGVAPNTLSSHLSILTRSGLTQVRRQGRSLYYSARIESVADLIQSLVQDCCDGHPDVCQPLAEVTQVSCATA